MVTVTAVIYQATKAVHVLKGSEETLNGECPLDIKVDLMVSWRETCGRVAVFIRAKETLFPIV